MQTSVESELAGERAEPISPTSQSRYLTQQVAKMQQSNLHYLTDGMAGHWF